MAWLTTEDGRRVNTEWFEEDERKKYAQIEEAARQAAERNEQTAMNARDVENMNEAQLDEEIAKTKSQIAKYDKAMGNNDITNTAQNKAMQEAFPLGAGGSGWSESAKRRKEASIESDTRKAASYTQAYDAKQAAEKRLKVLEDAKKRISGTGKTEKQIKKETIDKKAKSGGLTWKSSKNGTQGIYDAGDYRITHNAGGSFILHVGEKTFFYNSLKEAKAMAQMLDERKKK